MTGSIAAIVLLGFAPGGDANHLPTLGYGISTAPTHGGLVCGSYAVAPRVSGTCAVTPRVTGTLSKEEC